MMLLNMHRIGVPFRQVLLQIFFEIVFYAQPVNQLKHAQRVVAPVGVFRNGDVVCPANLVEVNKAMRCLHHGKAVLHAQGRLQAHPRKDAALVKGAQCRHALIGQRCATLPLFAKLCIKAGKRAGKSIPVCPEQVTVAQRPQAALGERADAQAVHLQNDNRLAGQAGIKRVVGVGGERKHYLLRDAQRLIFRGIFNELAQVVFARIGNSIKICALHAQHGWHIAVCALVPAPAIGRCGKPAILARLPAWCVDDGAPLDGIAVVVEYGWCFQL